MKNHKRWNLEPESRMMGRIGIVLTAIGMVFFTYASFIIAFCL